MSWNGDSQAQLPHIGLLSCELRAADCTCERAGNIARLSLTPSRTVQYQYRVFSFCRSLLTSLDKTLPQPPTVAISGNSPSKPAVCHLVYGSFKSGAFLTREQIAAAGLSCVYVHGKRLGLQRKKAFAETQRTPFDVVVVELAGIEPASASLLRADLHV